MIEEDKEYGIKKIAEPIGLIAAVIPTTNPTSTAIFKTLIALKTRNAIIISPHPRAKNCTIAAAKVVLDAAVIAFSYWLSWVIKFSGIFVKNSVRTLSFEQYMLALMAGVVLVFHSGLAMSSMLMMVTLIA